MTRLWVITESGHEHTHLVGICETLEAAKDMAALHHEAYFQERRRRYRNEPDERWEKGSDEWRPGYSPNEICHPAALWRGREWDEISIFPVEVGAYGGDLGWPYGPHNKE